MTRDDEEVVSMKIKLMTLKLPHEVISYYPLDKQKQNQKKTNKQNKPSFTRVGRSSNGLTASHYLHVYAQVVWKLLFLW